MREMDICLTCASRGRSNGDWRTTGHRQMLEIGGEISNSITSVQKDYMVMEIRALTRERTEEEKARRHKEGDRGATFSKSKRFTPRKDSISNTITTFISKEGLLMEKAENINLNDTLDNLEGKKFRIRKLTERTCFRLMGVDDKDIDKIQQAGISRSAQYQLAGNSIVVDVMVNLFDRLFYPDDEDKDTLF